MSLSVIIPVFNAESQLDILFNHLEENQFDLEDEVIFVDNGSTDSSKMLCEKYAAMNPSRYKLISYIEKPGSYAARNFGVKSSKGDILVFTDSDTKPENKWIQYIKENIKPGIVIAGHIELDIEENSLWEIYDKLAHLNSEKNASNHMVATANMAVRREDFLNVGFFEERFSGGDYDWSLRAYKFGLKIVFIPDATVHHPTRKTYEQILNKERRIAYGEGNHYKLLGKSKISLLFKYILKIFKIDTNIRYIKKLKKFHIKWSLLKEFEIKFFIIRIEHLKYAIYGYDMIDVRRLKIK